MGNPKSKRFRSLFRPFRSAPDSNLVQDPPASLSASVQSGSAGQSLGEQKSQQTALSPSTISRNSHFFKYLFSSPPPSPGVGPRRTSLDHNATSASQSLAVSASISPRPHSSYSGTSALQTHGTSLPDLNVTGGGNVTTVSSDGHGSPYSPDVQGSYFTSISAPISAPIIEVSYSLSEPIASKNLAPPSTCAPHIPTYQVQAPAKVDKHPAEPSMSTLDPDSTVPPPHSSVVWARTLEIAMNKLGDNSLPPLDLTTLTSQSAEQNIEAVITALNTWQKDDKKNDGAILGVGRKL